MKTERNTNMKLHQIINQLILTDDIDSDEANDLVFQIQEQLDVESGDTAGIHFSNSTAWEEGSDIYREEIVLKWIVAEIGEFFERRENISDQFTFKKSDDPQVEDDQYVFNEIDDFSIQVSENDGKSTKYLVHQWNEEDQYNWCYCELTSLQEAMEFIVQKASTYAEAFDRASEMMNKYPDLEPTSALKQSADDFGIEYGHEMGLFVSWARIQIRGGK